MMKLRLIHKTYFEYIEKIKDAKKLPKEEIKETIEQIKDEYIEQIRQILFYNI